MTPHSRLTAGRLRGLASALIQLEMVATRLRDRAAVHGGIVEETGYHAAAADVLEVVADRVDALARELTASVERDARRAGT